MGYHDWFKSGDVQIRSTASGTFINETVNGTAAAYFAGDYEYHAAIFAGTLGNTGTLFVYGAKDTSATSPLVLGSVVATASANGEIVFEFKTDTLTNLGTDYTHWTSQFKVDAAGTWRGALVLLDHGARSKGTTAAAIGISYLGTLYA
jgi:hypothetical protein